MKYCIVLLLALSFMYCASPSGKEQTQSQAQSAKPAIDVTGTWKLEEFKPSPMLPMPDSVIQQIKDKTILELNSDFSFRQTGIGREHTGSYEVAADGKSITYYHDARDVPFVEQIHQFTNGRMVVVDQSGNQMIRKKQ